MPRHPAHEIEIKNALAENFGVSARLARAQGELDTMLALSMEGLRTRQEIEPKLRATGDPMLLRDLADSHQSFGAAKFMKGDYVGSGESFANVLGLFSELSQRFPDDRNYRYEEARARSNIALVTYNLGKWPETIETS